MEKFLETQKLQKLNQEEIGNLKNVTSEVIEWVKNKTTTAKSQKSRASVQMPSLANSTNNLKKS